MIEDLRKLVKHSSIYGLGPILTRLVSVIMLPIYTRFLTPADYGLLEIVEVTIFIVTMFVNVGISSSVLRFYYQYDDKKDKDQVISSALVTLFGIFLLAYAVLMSAAPLFARYLLDDASLAHCFRVAFTTFLFSCGVEVPLSYLRARMKSLSFTLVNLVRLIIMLGLNIYFVVVAGKGALGVLYSSLIATVLVSIYLTVATLREVRFSYNWSKAKEMIRYGAPLIVSSLGVFVLSSSDRYFLKVLDADGLSTVGIYSLGYKFGMLILILVISPFQRTWSAQMFEIGGRPDAKDVYRKVFTYFNLTLLFFALGLSLFIDDAIKIIAGEAFWGAAGVVPIVSLAYVVNGWHTVLNLGILLEKKTQYIAVSTGVAAVVNLALNYFLIRRFSIYGAAWATVLSFAVRCAISYHFSQKIYPVIYEWSRVVRLFIYAGVLYGVSSVVHIPNLALSLTVRAGLLALFPLLLFTTNFLTDREKNWLRANWRRPWRMAASHSEGGSGQ